MASIDLNADLGEGDPYDTELLEVVSSCNIACGGHAGDRTSIENTMREALANGVTIGAHPSYPDREGFGRRSGFMSGAVLGAALGKQLELFASVAVELGVTIGHVKPHGALYTDAVGNASLATTIAQAVAAMRERPPLVGQPDTELEFAAQAQELDFVSEAFVDRAYQADGRLVPRSQQGAVHDNIERIREQAVSLAVEGKVTGVGADEIHVRADTLCIHGDTPGAAEAARAIRAALEHAGVSIHAVR